MLTDTQCRTAKPRAKLYKLADGQGLYLEVKPNGVKAWRYRFKLRNGDLDRESMFAIGNYGAAPSGETPEAAQARRDGGTFTLAEARDERAKARGLVKQGIDPVAARQLDRVKRTQANAITFESVAAEWLALKDWTEPTKTRRLDMLKRVVFPKIGALPVGPDCPGARPGRSHGIGKGQRASGSGRGPTGNVRRVRVGNCHLARRDRPGLPRAQGATSEQDPAQTGADG